MNTTRRSLMQGLGALPMASAVHAVAGPALLPAADLIPPLYAESLRLADLINNARHTEAEADALMELWGACDVAAVATRATTLAGTVASIEWARAELLEFGFRAYSFADDREAELAADKGDRLVLALLDGALGVLRAQGGVA